MARLWSAGAESVDAAVIVASKAIESSFTGGTASARSIDSSIFRSGSKSFKVDSGASNVVSDWVVSYTGVLGRSFWGRIYFYVTSLPTTTALIFGSFQYGVNLTTAGKLQLLSGATQIGSDSVTTIAPNTWYRIELLEKIVVGAGDSTELRLDGVTVASDYNRNDTDNVATPSFTWGWNTSPGANKVIYFDDFALNDDQGANQNSWPGEGRLVLLLPTATSGTPAAKWTDNTGTQTAMWEGVNNTPPIGIAAAVSPAHSYIKHAGGAAGTTDEFDATMTTYAAAGIVSVDTISCIQYIVITGEESATGTKLLAIKGVSNPVVAQGNNFDVFPASGAQGIYPNNWSIIRDGIAVQYNPSVVIGTAPVFGVVRPETATRVASVCFMGMYVDYIHPTTAPPSSESDFIPAKSSQIVSVNRASFY